MDFKEDMKMGKNNLKMEKNDLKKLSVLSHDELLRIEGGGLSELTANFVDGVGYAVGWFWSRANSIPAHESALLGPNSRPTV